MSQHPSVYRVDLLTRLITGAHTAAMSRESAAGGAESEKGMAADGWWSLFLGRQGLTRAGFFAVCLRVRCGLPGDCGKALRTVLSSTCARVWVISALSASFFVFSCMRSASSVNGECGLLQHMRSSACRVCAPGLGRLSRCCLFSIGPHDYPCGLTLVSNSAPKLLSGPRPPTPPTRRPICRRGLRRPDRALAARRRPRRPRQRPRRVSLPSLRRQARRVPAQRAAVATPAGVCGSYDRPHQARCGEAPVLWCAAGGNDS